MDFMLVQLLLFYVNRNRMIANEVTFQNVDATKDTVLESCTCSTPRGVRTRNLPYTQPILQSGVGKNPVISRCIVRTTMALAVLVLLDDGELTGPRQASGEDSMKALPLMRIIIQL
eukprot:scaffold14050_cov163-Cylindrotheca_fusiformis.AAC.2